ncbi:MAG: hypothetical protein VB082_09170 [Christensenella sp.]|nr:hypothetical protein [Christensenella sp.]
MSSNKKDSYAQSAYGNKWGMQTKSEAESRRQEEERRRKEEEARRRAEERRKKEEEARQKREEATRQQNSVKNSTNKVYTHEEYTKEQNQKSYGSDVYGSVDKPKQVGAKKNTPQSLFGTPGTVPGNPFGVPGAIKQPDDADRIMNVLENEYGWGNTKKDAGMDNAGYADDVYGSVDKPRYGGAVAKKSQVLPGLTPLGKDELTPEQEKVFLDTLFEVPEKSDPIPTYGPKGETKEEKTMRELIGYLTEDGYQPETPQEYAKRLAEEKQQQAAMNNAGYVNDVYGSVNKSRYGSTVAKKPQALPGLTPIGAQAGNAFSLPQTPGAATSSAMDNAGYANDVYGSVSNPKYGGTVAKKPKVLPGLTPPGAENIMGGSTTNGTGMLYNKNNPNKMTKNGINLGASAYNYNKGQNGAVNMSDMQASSVVGEPQPQPTQVPQPVPRTKSPWDGEPDAQPQYGEEGIIQPAAGETTELEKLLQEDMETITKLKSIKSPKEAVKVVDENDKLIQKTAKKYGVPPAMLQAVLLRENGFLGIDDEFADTAVKIGLKADSSTGIGQVTAKTAIKAENFLNHGTTGYIPLDPENKADLRKMWDKLQDDEYNIEMMAKVLKYEAVRESIDLNNASMEQIELVLSRYNGTGENAVRYGEEVMRYYDLYNRED